MFRFQSLTFSLISIAPMIEKTISIVKSTLLSFLYSFFYVDSDLSDGVFESVSKFR